MQLKDHVTVELHHRKDEPETRQDSCSDFPIHFAIHHGFPDIIEMSLAEIEITLHDQVRSLQLAAQSERPTIVAQLLDDESGTAVIEEALVGAPTHCEQPVVAILAKKYNDVSKC